MPPVGFKTVTLSDAIMAKVDAVRKSILEVPNYYYVWRLRGPGAVIEAALDAYLAAHPAAPDPAKRKR